MICSICSGRVEWQGRLTQLTSSNSTICLSCGAVNSQIAEELPEMDANSVSKEDRYA